MSLLAALGLLCDLIQGAEGVPDGLKGFAALIAKAQAEGRAIQPEEIAALQIKDDQMRAALEAAIAKSQETP